MASRSHAAVGRVARDRLEHCAGSSASLACACAPGTGLDERNSLVSVVATMGMCSANSDGSSLRGASVIVVDIKLEAMGCPACAGATCTIYAA